MEYKTYPTSDGSVYYYDCPIGSTINGVSRETINVPSEDFCYEDGTIEVYPTSINNLAYVSVFIECDCFDGYISEHKAVSLDELAEFVEEYTTLDYIESSNIKGA